MSLQSLLVKRAKEMLEKQGFQPMPGGQPPPDPNAMAQQGAGAPPMDPSQMGGGGGMPMDPSMMGGMPQGMGMPMDPSMMAQTATIGSLSITDYQAVMTDMLTNVLQQILPAIVQEVASAVHGGGAGAAPGGPDPSQVAPQEDARAVSNTEISEKLDALIGLLSGAGGAGPAGPAPVPEEMPAPGSEMGFGGQGIGGMPPPMQQPMEVSAGVKPSRRFGLADIILKKTAQARR